MYSNNNRGDVINKMEIKTLNKKKIAIIIGIVLIIAIIILLVSLYIAKKDFRNWIDVNILRKDITEEDVVTINLNTDKKNQIYAYSKYIALLNDRAITLYNNFGEEITKIDININTAIFDSNNKYLAIAEEKGQEVCLILDKTYLWSNTLEGNILQVQVNENGYVAVVWSDMTYKSIVTLYDSSGNKLFNRYFADNRVIDVSISKDNKYVAVGDIDTSGALIKSNIRIISVQNAQTDTDNAIIYTYNANSGKLIINVEYQSKNQILCMYDDSISMIKDNKNIELLSEENEVSFMSVNFSNYMMYTEEDSSLFSANTNVKIVNTSNNKTSLFNVEEIAKDIYANEDIIAINLGTEVYFVDTTGWIIKKYSDKQEITNIVFSKNLAGIVYKDKIIIINL